mgnify:CR=1 FL=1
MHLIEAYSSNTRLKIDKPEIYLKYFPIPYERFITFQTSSAMPAKNYGYFQEVLDLISNKLKEANIKVLQLGAKDEPKLGGVLDLLGKTTINQSAYIISKAALHVGIDSCLTHFASAFNTPLVSIYSVSPPSICGPFWGEKAKQICLEPPFTDRKYSFNPNENPSVSNLIYPEIVANSILKLLGLEGQVNISTVYIGKMYNSPSIETIPDAVINPNFINGVLNIRGDQLFNENNIYAQLSLCKCAVVIDRPLRIDVLKQLKPNLSLLALKIDNFPNLISYLKEVKKAAIQYSLITDIQSDEELNKYKIDLYEYGLIIKQDKITKNEVEFSGKLDDNIEVKSKSMTLSNGKVYLSLAHWKAQRPCENINNVTEKVIDSTDFWSNYERYWFYKRK